ncbi:ABC transporter substrate-binding protein [Paenibacillus sp. MSJ-34]|uniref:ABC transporter substrate-binding protein n=1 Tax=Paenibacillus sp. MSJ-34 TaxID=2841529 RepID=UPI001C11CCD8|nr:extracellular solute-binding protein [Paenibacillus sp. MSJ-34]MBU5443941.1 extracellular solute-binding protein [Paenibacillus sp. MSJ-34]
MMTRSTKWITLLLLALSLAAAGCGQSGGNAGGGSEGEGNAAADQPYKGQQISVLLEGHPTSNAMQKMLPEFEEKTGIKVNLEIVPYSDLTSKALMNFSSSSGRYDVVMDDMVHGIGYVNAGYVEPLDSFMQNESLTAYYDAQDFVPKYLDVMKVNGQSYGLPVYGESNFLMYRKDLYENKLFNIKALKSLGPKRFPKQH